MQQTSNKTFKGSILVDVLGLLQVSQATLALILTLVTLHPSQDAKLQPHLPWGRSQAVTKLDTPGFAFIAHAQGVECASIAHGLSAKDTLFAVAVTVCMSNAKRKGGCEVWCPGSHEPSIWCL